jgi:DNA-binding NarL/FixJ family response regulator
MWERDEDCSIAPGPLVVYPVQRGLIGEARGIELLGAGGREREAAAAFLDAAALHEQYLRRNALRCRWAAGEALRRAGEDDEAAQVLERVADDCARHGFEPLGRRISASLRQLGAPCLASGDRSGRARNGVLTARETEVLALVRQGLPTAEIAARLQLRPSTVESHVRKAMKRLGASNRREAAFRAHDDQ